MANIWEKAILILAGNLNLGPSYLITTVCPILKGFCILPWLIYVLLLAVGRKKGQMCSFADFELAARNTEVEGISWRAQSF